MSYYRQFTWYGYGYLIPVRYWYGTRTGTVQSGGHSYSYWYGNWYGMSIGSKSIVFIGRVLRLLIFDRDRSSFGGFRSPRTKKFSPKSARPYFLEKSIQFLALGRVFVKIRRRSRKVQQILKNSTREKIREKKRFGKRYHMSLVTLSKFS